ncbi:Hypothetical predicted protein, partial [Paramuricea clavata]
MDATQILLIPATVIGSVVLLVSCLFFKNRLRKKKRNEPSSVPDKNKSGKRLNLKDIKETAISYKFILQYENT